MPFQEHIYNKHSVCFKPNPPSLSRYRELKTLPLKEINVERKREGEKGGGREKEGKEQRKEIKKPLLTAGCNTTPLRMKPSYDTWRWSSK